MADEDMPHLFIYSFDCQISDELGWMPYACFEYLQPRFQPCDRNATINDMVRLQDDEDGMTRWCTQAELPQVRRRIAIHNARFKGLAPALAIQPEITATDGFPCRYYITPALEEDVGWMPEEYFQRMIPYVEDIGHIWLEAMVRLEDEFGCSIWCTRRAYPGLAPRMPHVSNRYSLPSVPDRGDVDEDELMGGEDGREPGGEDSDSTGMDLDDDNGEQVGSALIIGNGGNGLGQAPTTGFGNGGPQQLAMPLPTAQPAFLPTPGHQPAPTPGVTAAAKVTWDNRKRYVIRKLWEQQPKISGTDRAKIFNHIFQAEVQAAGFTAAAGFPDGIPYTRLDSQAGMRVRDKKHGGIPKHWLPLLAPAVGQAEKAWRDRLDLDIVNAKQALGI